MIDLDPTAQALVDAVRATECGSEWDKARIRRQVLARVAAASLAAGVGGATAGAPDANAATSELAGGVAGASASAGIGATKIALAGAATTTLIAGAVAIAWFVGNHRESVAPTPAAPPPPVASFPSAALPTPEPLPTAALVPKSMARAEPETVAAGHEKVGRRHAANGPTLERELPLLQSAQEALRNGDVDRALALLDLHARRFPEGMLAPERRAVHAMAVCRKSGRAAGQAEANEFLREAPGSPLAARVRAVCALDLPAEGPATDR